MHIGINHSEKKITEVNEDEIVEIGPKFTCPVSKCKRSFSKQQELDSHLLLTHKEIRYSCTECQRIFNDKQVLILHLQLVHAIEKSDMKLPIVNSANKELLGYVVTEANQKSMTSVLETVTLPEFPIQKIPESSIESVVLEDDDIIEQIDDMIEKIDNDDDISIIGK